MAQSIRECSRSLEVSLVLVILSTALVLRAVNLDADPSALIRRDFITDEGQWAHNVRNALAYGQWQLDGYNPAPYSAYLYQHLLRFVVSTVGMSLAAVRLLSALFGWLTVVLIFVWVRRETNKRRAILAALLLGVSNLHVLYSRTGFVESTMVFFLALTLCLWSLRQKHNVFAILSGVAFGLMLLTKVTAIYVVPGLALLSAAEVIRNTTSKRAALLFLSGASLVGASYAIGFVAPNFNNWINYNLAAGLDNEWPRHPSDLIYSTLKLLGARFYGETPILTALTLVALVGLIIRISTSGLKSAIRGASKVEITSATLLIGYWFSIGLTVYQPERRFIPALFLMVALSASVLDRGWTSIEAVAEGRTRMRAGGWFAVLFALPAIAILELKWASVGSVLSLRFWLFKAAALAVLVIISIDISRRRSPSPLKRKLLSVSRLIFVLLFCALSLGLVYRAMTLWGFSAGELRSGRFVISAILILAGAIAVMAALNLKPQVAALIIAAFISIEGIQVSTWLLQPTYTLKQANGTLAGLLREGQTVITHYETLLLTSRAKVVCYWPKAGFNVDAFERFNPDYILVLRRDNWRDFDLAEMPTDEWPPPTPSAPTAIARFDLCPTRVRGPRLSLELYSLKQTDLEDSTAPDQSGRSTLLLP